MYFTRRTKFTALCLLISAHLFSNSVVYQNYVENFQVIAVSEMNRTGIPASIKLAQGILESNAGRSYLAVNANNHFGIKCGSNYSGPSAYRKDDEYDRNGKLKSSCFRKYRSASESYKAHSAFLMDAKKAYRYGFLFKLDKTDYKG
ncbi:MAG: glucosaminidase domain-containing protein, partial [Bacteroidota bacterium]